MRDFDTLAEAEAFDAGRRSAASALDRVFAGLLFAALACGLVLGFCGRAMMDRAKPANPGNVREVRVLPNGWRQLRSEEELDRALRAGRHVFFFLDGRNRSIPAEWVGR